MDIKPEIIKTIKRLSTQKNYDVLKNKLRSWIVTKELTISDLLRNCREKTLQISPNILNKLGVLFSTGKEGLNEDPESAFVFYLTAADLGHPAANGNVAQYYFDGRAPGGKNLDQAYTYCKKAIELGCDKYMLMSEILHEKQDYAETIRYLRKIIETKKISAVQTNADVVKKKIEARKLEIECLYKQLHRTFMKIFEENGFQNINTKLNINKINSTFNIDTTSSMTVGNASPQSRWGNVNSGSLGSTRTTSPLYKATINIPTVNTHKLSAHIFNNSNIISSPQRIIQSATKGHFHQNHRSHLNQGDHQVFHHRFPGWFYISDDLEGFDLNSCAELTARAEIIELEAEAIKSAFETAEQRVIHAKKNKFSEEVISVLMKNKVNEFQDIYRQLESNKTLLLETWNAYVDTNEHILRRQVLTEKRYFHPARTKNAIALQLAIEIFRRRVYDYSDYLDADWNTYYKPDEHLNEPLVMLSFSAVNYRIAPARTILTAERSLFETAMNTYGRCTGYHRSQKTGWTGTLNHHTNSSQPANDHEVEANHKPNKSHHETEESPAKDSANKSNSVSNTASNNQLREQLLMENTFVETVVIGSSVLRYQHKTHPRITEFHPHQNNALHCEIRGARSAQSYYQMEELGDSYNILKFLQRVTMVDDDVSFLENEKRLVELIIAFLHDGKPFALSDLQMMNEDLTEQDCVYLTRIVYHYFVKRLVIWVLSCNTDGHIINQNAEETSAYEKGRELPLASAQCRALFLIRAGILTFEECFQLESNYGIFYFYDDEASHLAENAEMPETTAKAHLNDHHQHLSRAQSSHRHQKSEHNNHAQNHNSKPKHHTFERLRNQIICINQLYQKAILEVSGANFHPQIQFWKHHRHGVTIPTCKTLKRELQEVFGGEADSDDEVETLEDAYKREDYGSDDRELENLLAKLKL